MRKKIAVVSLGCDKNRVDTERMLYNLSAGGHTLTNEFEKAEIIIVNTCAFIEPARIEAIDTILQMAEYKKDCCQKLVVTGCLPQKYESEIKTDLTEVDAFLGTNNYDGICSVIEKLYQNERISETNPCDISENTNRIITTPLHYAYLKIADGCDNHCTFCTIPSIRGKYISRTIESLIAEAQKLIENGAKEIILVAQDVTRYGVDIYGKSRLIDLIRELSKLDVTWIRLMYCYPELVTDELISEIDNNEKLAKYIDVPFQHVDDKILKLMNRRSHSNQIKTLLSKIRNAKNYISVRTTLMTGFPSEGESEFENLLNFVREQKIANVGVFAYCLEEDTPSAKIAGHINDKEKLKRVEKLGKQHLKNCIEYNKSMIGKTVKVLYEDIDFDKNMFVGRTEYNAPNIDTVVYFSGKFASVGEFYNVKITDFNGYDLIGEII